MVTPEPPKPLEGRRYSDEITSIVPDYIASRNRVEDEPTELKKIAKDVKQRRAVLAQFAEATNVTDLLNLRQEDLFYYVSVV